MQNRHFESIMHGLECALDSIDTAVFEKLVFDCESTLKNGGKIIASGLGKNVPICDKFVGTMLSIGLNAGFLHTNSAVHGDMGMIHKGDLVIILSKSGSTFESVYLVDLLQNRFQDKDITMWLLTFSKNSKLADVMDNKLIITLENEGDPWNIIPNNSTTINLIVLQEVAMELINRLGLTLEEDFKPNHPGGAIGEYLRNEK